MFKLALIFISVILIVLLFRKWYLNNQEIENNIPVLENVLIHKIKANEIDSFINDNDTAIIYMCVSNNQNCRNFEKDIKSLITKKSLGDVIVYLDLNSAININEFLNNLETKYKANVSLKEYPTVLYFENATIKENISGLDLTKKDFENFLKEIDIIQ